MESVEEGPSSASRHAFLLQRRMDSNSLNARFYNGKEKWLDDGKR